MQIIENLKVKEKVYIEKLENGLTVMIIPKKNVQKKYVIWGVHYGSNDSRFIAPGETEETVVPDGVAHFLEHKMFEQENGQNSLDVLSGLGVSANAYTTNDHTAYLFECTDKFYEALDELMDYVQNPYFTDENVEKEKGIINQEIMMYADYPSWKVYINALNAMYIKNPVRIDTAGTVETVSKINKDILYKCYNTFYNPSNMAMVICGDFKPEEILEEVKKRLINKKDYGEIKRVYPKEPEKIAKKEVIEKMDLSQPLFTIGYKVDIQDYENIIKEHIAIEIILNLVIGKSSKLYKKLYDEGILIAEPSLDFEFTKRYGHILIAGQSKDPREVASQIKNSVKELEDKGIDKADFERIRKMIYGSYVKEYNDVSETARMFLADYFKGIDSFDYIENCNLVTFEYVKQVLQDVFKEEKMVLSIVDVKA